MLTCRRLLSSLTAGLLLISGMAASHAELQPRAPQTWQMHPATVAHMLNVLRTENTPGKMRAAMALGKAGVASPEVMEALAALLDNPYAPARATAVFALGRTASRQAVSTILPYLADPSADVRVEACGALASLNASAAAERLPLADPDSQVRLAALQTAERLNANALAPALQQRFAAESEPQLRARIIACLTTWRNRQQGLALASAGLADPDLEVMIAALGWFSAVGTDANRSVQRLRDALGHASPLVRQAALPAVVQVYQAKAQNDLAKACHDPDHMVRKAAALLLGKIEASRETELLLIALQNDPVRWVRRAASTTLAQYAQANAATAARLEQGAIERLTAADARLVHEQLWLLGTLKSKAGAAAALPQAISAFPSSTAANAPALDFRRSQLIAWLAGEAGYEPAGPLMISYFAQPLDRALRVHGARSLGALRYEPAVATMSTRLKNVKVEMGVPFFTYSGPERTAALWALGQIGTPAALTTLTHLAGSLRPLESEDDIQAICDALIQHKHLAAVQPLTRVALHKETSEQTRLGIAQSLEKLTGKKLLRSEAGTAHPGYDIFFLNAK